MRYLRAHAIISAMINVEVQKTATENNANLIRRFTKKMQSSGVVQRVRSLRYHARPGSTAQKKKQALKTLARRDKYAELMKLGKITERTPTKGGR